MRSLFKTLAAWVLFLAMAVLLIWIQACTNAYAEEPGNVSLELIYVQAVDSVGIEVWWQPASPAAMGSRRFPLSHHHIHIMTDSAVIGERSTGILRAPVNGFVYDTVIIPQPPLLDTLRIYAVVQAVDVSGLGGPFSASEWYNVVITPLAPLPVDSVGIDTIPVPLAEVVVWPDSVEVYVGATVQFCAFGRDVNGVAFVLANSTPHPACDVMFETFRYGDPSLTHYLKALNYVAIGRSEQEAS